LKPEIYISIDIEADGPIPGDNSMLSLGAAAFILDPKVTDPKCEVHTYLMADGRCTCPGWSITGRFQANLEALPGATPNHDTMQWWSTQPDAWDACRKNLQPPEQAMAKFKAWVIEIAKDGPVVLAGYPVTYDFNFVYWYTIHFCGFPAPFGFQGLGIKTLAADRMGCSYKHATKKNMPKRWFVGAPKHTHEALDDAIGQGVLLMNILKERSPHASAL